ncbi:cryptochrome/photolyase family protein [Thalassotalea fusca]
MLLWFRNDLRVHDNPALRYFLSNKSAENIGRALVFVSEKQWRQHDWSHHKILFIKRHIAQLKAQLDRCSIQLMVVSVDTFEQQVEYIVEYCRNNQVSEAVANKELEFNENQRDQECIERGINLTLFESDTIVPKTALMNKSGQRFKVFTPYRKAWLEYVKVHGFEYLDKDSLPSSLFCTTVEESPQHEQATDWPLASEIEEHKLPQFFNENLFNYADERDFPAKNSTSKLSPYLAIGAISPKYLLAQLIQRYPDILSATDAPYFSWLNELIWREFYRYLISHHQRLCRHQCFKLNYQSLKWPNHQELFDAWCNARTGYPIVDAAMRQLVQTGWMHNRLRMIVASFLTKHLLVDWRWGEKFFMNHLIDGDLAANNGGWQWAASTGCDAQPYFRIFNPITQSKRFDPDGSFIRTFLPELNDVPDKEIHFPHDYLAKQKLQTYWPAIVEHKQAREQALAFYKGQ